MPNSIKVTDKLEIQSLTVKDPQVVAAAKAIQAEGKDLAEYLEQVITVGVKVLQVAGVSLGVEMLVDSVERTKKDLGDSSKKFNEEISARLDAAVGPEGNLTKSINVKVEEFGEELAAMVSSEDSPIREALQKQFDAFAKKMNEDIARSHSTQKDDIAKIVDISNPLSPLRPFGEEMKKIGEAVNIVREQIATDATVAEIISETPIGGVNYEEAAIRMVQQIAGFAGDDCLAVGGVTGLIPRNKMGDGVIDLKVGASVFARIVVECKDSDLTKAKWIAESEGGRANRGATGFIGLCKELDDMPNKSRMLVLDSQGIVLAYDPAKDDPQILHLIYQVVKFNTLRASGSLDDVDLAEVNRELEEAMQALNRFDSLNKSVKAIENSADSIRKDATEIKRAITGNISAVRLAISKNIEPYELEGSSQPLELEAGETEDGDVY
jgi:hypothetical protein